MCFRIDKESLDGAIYDNIVVWQCTLIIPWDIMHTSKEKELQSRLNAVEGSLTRLLNHLAGAAYRCSFSNYNYTMAFISNGSTKLLGMTPASIMVNPCNIIERIMLPEHLANVRRTMQESIEKKIPYGMYYAIRLPNEEKKWIWDQGEGVYDDAGNCIFLEGIMMDVTEQKNKELKLKRENRELRSSCYGDNVFDKIIGHSMPMQRVYSLMHKAASSDTNVILYGETGVGKDLIAKTIHKISEVKGRYIPVNCAAIPEQLLESEFFGHVKGAFSGASVNRAGYLAAADGGTLFLDEIGELPVNLQVKLLRAIESKSYTPIGSTEVRSSSFRLITATNRNLKEMVATGGMRADFFFRINVLSIVLPPLRERQSDIHLLIQAFAARKGIQTPIPEQVLQMLLAYSWPGNVRELHNVLERYWAFGRDALDFNDALPPKYAPIISQVAEQPQEKHGVILPVSEINQMGLPLSTAKEQEEARHILETLAICQGKKGKTAEALGISFRTLQRKLKKYCIS